ncbi:polyisoprenoid-binding protein YceI [Paraburkholderia silvatlantica]|uniref:Polyisoprenoid-binding protein YceI n=1 Tax=Paraburkholderia silvatlantica TaxID=321895 RepID=A0A2V4TVU3_9BURK|nr:YceI family protein [Paraburkholderia silvatlantica]PYE18233.1 polyisoprenoid-binding protein YceI [Paraburkholderia silvatlantica]
MLDRNPIRRRGVTLVRLKPHAAAIAMFACTACAAAVASGDPADPVDTPAPLAQYRLDPARSGVTFDVANVWHSNLTMRFSRIGAELDGLEGLASGRVTVTIDAASLEANAPFVAGIAEGGGMLDVAHYPAIRFVSTRLVRLGPLNGLLTGDLTIRTTTRPVTLDVTFDTDPHDPPGARQTLAFTADGHFSRAAFGLTRWSSAVGDDVHMRIRAEFVRQRADP